MNHGPISGALLEFQCRGDEYLEARRATARLRPIEYWMNRAWGSLLVVVGCMVSTRAPAEARGYLVAVVGIALLLNGTLLFRLRVRAEWRTIPRLHYRTWLGIGDAGLRLTTVDGDVPVPWSAIRHVVETPNTFTLCRASDDFLVIPKRAFSSASQVIGFRTRLAIACPQARSVTLDADGRRRCLSDPPDGKKETS